MTAILIALGLVALWVAVAYNGLVRLRQQCRDAWAGIDTELKRRYDLIPNLVAVVRGYAAHEREVLDALVAARAAAVASRGAPASQAADENRLVASMRRLWAVVERYPDLKAAGNFLALQRQLVETEDRIQAARRFFNGNVRDYNTRLEVFPSNLVGSLFRFRGEQFFEIETAAERLAPVVGVDPPPPPPAPAA